MVFRFQPDRTRWTALCYLLVVSPVLVNVGCQQKEADKSELSVKTESPTHAVGTAVQRPKHTKPSGVLPRFVSVGAESGFDFERFDDMQGQRRSLEVNGGGVAVFDFDRDGWLDVLMTNGCRLPVRADDQATPSCLFRNRGGLQFELANEETHFAQFGFASGCIVGDYNADGFDDVYVASIRENRLWRNNGDGTFSDDSSILPHAVDAWSSSAAFADINGDGHLDLYVVNYLEESDENPKLCPNSKSPSGFVACPPAMFEGADDVLFLSDGEGGFVDATESSGVGGRRGKGLGVVVCDLNGDLIPEIYVANDGQMNFLFVRRESEDDETLVFEERALRAGIALNESGFAQASMGVTCGDYDADGTIDLFMTHFKDDSNTLYANRGKLDFGDVTRESRLGPPSREYLGFGTVFCDLRNNGQLDLFVANGHIEDRSFNTPDDTHRQWPQLFLNAGDGQFDEVTPWAGPYFEQKWIGRGASVGDLDRDGKQDLIVSHQSDSSLILHNQTDLSHPSLTLQLIGIGSNRNGFGTRIETRLGERLIVRELSGGGSFQSSLAPEIHLGLGTELVIDVEVTWPSGQQQTFNRISAGYWQIIEGQPAAWQLNVPQTDE